MRNVRTDLRNTILDRTDEIFLDEGMKSRIPMFLLG